MKSKIFFKCFNIFSLNNLNITTYLNIEFLNNFLFYLKKKDGDYNKVIPEMQKEINKHYCVNSNQNYSSSDSLLCQKCNRNQEMKMSEMKNFEAKMDVI